MVLKISITLYWEIIFNIENESSSEMHVHYIKFCFQIDKQYRYSVVNYRL